MDERDIRAVIEQSLCQGALNRLDTDAMRRGFHEDFTIFSVVDGKLDALPLTPFIRIVEAYRDDAAQRESGIRDMEYEIVSVDVTGTAAAAKVRFFRQGEPIFTDYLTLLKFAEGWRMVGKVSHNHVPDPWTQD